MAYPRKPDKLKSTAGTYRKDRADPVPALPTLKSAPPCPTWIKDIQAVSEWKRLAPIMLANGLLTSGNIVLLAQVVSLHAVLIRMWESGDTPSAARLLTFRSLLASLGLLGLGLSEKAKPENKFASNAARKKLA